MALSDALVPAAALVGYWLVAAVVLSPLLSAGSIRRLCRGWPTRSWAGNYALGTVGLVVAHVGTVVASGLGLQAAAAAGVGRQALPNEAGATVLASVGVVAVAWTGLAVGLPATGRWDPTADGWDGRLVLAAGAVWYLVASTVAIGLFVLLVFLVNYPG